MGTGKSSRRNTNLLPVEPRPDTGLKGLDISPSLRAFSASISSMGSVMSGYYRSGKNAVCGTDKERIQVYGRVDITKKESDTQISGRNEIERDRLPEPEGDNAGKSVTYGGQSKSGHIEQNHIRSCDCDCERNYKVGHLRSAAVDETKETEQIGGKMK